MPLPAPGWAACAYVQLSMRRSGTRPKCPVLFVTRVRGRGSQLAIVASTLVIAALFNPLRQRGQNLIDRRLYRRKSEDVIDLLEDVTRGDRPRGSERRAAVRDTGDHATRAHLFVVAADVEKGVNGAL